MHRVNVRPALTFEAWARQQGIELPPEHIVAEVIGGALQPKTRAQRGKWKSSVRKLAQLHAAQAAYEAAIARGEIPVVVERVPLDLSRSADRAYARAQTRRRARRRDS